MKSIPCLFILLLSLSGGFAFADAPPAVVPAPTVVGHWFFHMKLYQGHQMPEPPDATLRLHFAFREGGESELWWWHEGEGDHCRRRGTYTVEATNIVEETTWIDPANTPLCGQDPDMQLGRKTRTPYYFYGDDLALRFQLADEPLDVIWKRLTEEN